MNLNLLTTPRLVEIPYIWVEIGGFAFGTYSSKSTPVVDTSGFTKRYKATFPNYVKSITVNKVSGTLNTYNIQLVYAIRPGEDPNKIDKIISSISSTRKISISYGDLNTPNFLYKDEGALITQITKSLNVDNATINYTITATSAATCLQAGNFNFSRRVDKPSNIIRELINNETRGLLDVFPGMRNKTLVASKNLIANDDRSVTIQAKTNISIFEYLKYLVSCMSCVTDSKDSLTGKHSYILTIQDDFTGELGGAYFKVTKTATNLQEINSLDMFEVDIGYPSHNIVTSFSVNDNQSYALLYDYARSTQQTEYICKINDDGTTEYEYSPALSTSKNLYISTEADRNWWSKVTQYPISATIELKGLLRPAILMTYIKVNVYFYGQKENSSGIYIITSQQDSVNEGGYRTTLGLTRIAGDI